MRYHKWTAEEKAEVGERTISDTRLAAKLGVSVKAVRAVRYRVFGLRQLRLPLDRPGELRA